MTAPKDAPERDLYDELTDGKGPCNQHAPNVTPPKDALVEPDFVAMAVAHMRQNRWPESEIPNFAGWVADAMEYAFAAGRQAAPQPEGGEQLRGDGDKAYSYLRRLFEHLAPQCEALPDLMGLCTQIDNYIAGSRQHIAALKAAGYVIVLREPTPEMVEAGRAALSQGERVQTHARVMWVWEAMLTAAAGKDSVEAGP